MQCLKKGDVVKIKNMPMSIHNEHVKGKVGLVIGQTNNGKKYKDEQIIVSVPNYKILWILPHHLEKVNERG